MRFIASSIKSVTHTADTPPTFAMADAALASLRQADANLYKTAMRAEQLQNAEPIVAYWCDYWVLKQILSKGLHTSSPDILEYSTKLMNRMEHTKDTRGTEPAIADDTEGQVYIEQFAQKRLDSAQNVVKANKVTATTANTFDAAATLFGLVNIWGAPETETIQKIKYAKWNATRILRAIKDGKDPNESNPKPDELPPLAKDDESLAGALSPGSEVPPSAPSSAPRPVTIEDEVDGDNTLAPSTDSRTRRDSAGVSLPHSPASSAAAPASTSGGGLPDLPPPASGALPSFGAGSPTAPPAAAASPTIYTDDPDTSVPPANFSPTAPTFSPPTAPPDLFYQPPSSHQQPSAPPSAPPPAASAPTNGGYFAGASAPTPPAAATGYPPAYNNRVVPQPSAPPPPAAAPAPQPAVGPVDDLAMVNAQKHAKWAISALNFEDVSTAVKELRKALEFLGAS